MKHLINRVFTLSILMILAVGCNNVEYDAPYSPSTTPSAQDSTETPTFTPIPSDTPSPTATYTPEASATFPPLPNFLSLSIANQPVLSSSDDPSCQLPCWQGLTPGESTLADIQQVAREVFCFDEGRVNAMPGKFDEGLPYQSAEGVYHYVSGWKLDPSKEDSGYISISFVIDESTTLQGIEIAQVPGGEYPVSTPQQMVEVLGTPDYIDVVITHEFDWTGTLAMHFIYADKGIGYQFDLKNEPVAISNDRSSATYAPLCFNKTPYFADVVFVPPLEGLSDQNVTVTQQGWILDQIGQGFWSPIEEQLEMSIDKFVELILQSEPCLEIDFASAPFA